MTPSTSSSSWWRVRRLLPLVAPCEEMTIRRAWEFFVLVFVIALLFRTPAAKATSAENESETESSEGLLSLLQSLVQATASRVSGLVLGHGSDPTDSADDEDADYKDAVATPAPSKRVRYHGYQLVRVRLRSRKQASQLRRLVEAQDGAQLWQHARQNRTADVLLAPAVAPTLKDSLDDMGLSYSVLTADVQKIIKFQNPPRVNPRRRTTMLQSRGHPFTWKRYHRYDDIVSYMYYLSSTYPQLAQVLTIGSSSEGRPLYVLKISVNERNKPRHRTANASRSNPHYRTRKKPAVWIDAGTHGREWISPAVALYISMQLVERFDSNPHLAGDADWYILPVLNPDGYEYSHTTDRLWRKSRSTPELPTSRLFSHRVPCTGVDLNRNWNYNWGDRAGASDDPCSDMYAGPRPFSEPESRAAANFILKRQERLQLFISLHSYSQLWIIPEDDQYKHLPDYQEMYNKALLAVRALRRTRNTRYNIGTASEMLYTISGCADNWAKIVAGIKYAYTVELPDRGRYGFLLPASFIIPTGKETFSAVKELAQAIVCKP